MPRKRKLPDGMVEREGREGYYADFTIGGNRVRRFLGTDFKAATEILNELKARAQKADFNILDNSYPIADLRRQWLAHCKQALKPRTATWYEERLDNILKFITVPRVSQLTTAQIISYREKRLLQGVSPRTVNTEVGSLTIMLNWGVEHRLIGSNPLSALSVLPHDDPKKGRALEAEEVTALLEASAPRWKAFWYVLAVTGMRLSEAANLRFSDIDFENREVIVRSRVAKNHSERRIPMDDGLHDLLRRLEAELPLREPGKGRIPRDRARTQARFTRDHVFVTGQNTPHTNRANVYKAFIACCERAGIDTKTSDDDGNPVEHVDVHSLRRTFATNLIVNGADPNTVRELLGHKTLAMTMKIYAKVMAQTKRQAVAKLSYGSGTTPPAHKLDMTARDVGEPIRHQSVTKSENESQSQVG